MGIHVQCHVHIGMTKQFLYFLGRCAERKQVTRIRVTESVKMKTFKAFKSLSDNCMIRYHVGSFMAAVNIEPAKDQLKDKQLITVSDCCCGAGCLLIAFANEAMKAHIDFQSRVLFVAQDLDYVAGLMCYIQLSLLGCKAIVKIGNSLTDPFVGSDMETDSVWLSPMYTQEETFRLMRFLENMMSLSNTEGEGKQNEDADVPTTKVSA